ncbi:MAG: type II toxin-antitoxin system Phd/YefM family antitoxin [Acidimicrobiales bacterium]
MTDRPTTIGVAEAKRRFADVLGAVRYRGERYVIERNGTPMAALVPVSEVRGPAGPATPIGFLALVGAFEDASEYPDSLLAVVDDRDSQVPGVAPALDP